jgi:hypothetical protein
MLPVPAGTVAFKGTWAAAVLLLVKETSAPLVGAAPLSVSVPVLGEPPLTVLGFNVSDIREATPTVSVVVRVVPYVPEIVTLVEDATPPLAQ